jgi:ribosomal protein L2
MPIKKIRPITTGQRNISVQSFKDVTASEPEKSLISIPQNACRTH